MHIYSKPDLPIQEFSGLPLFDWRSAVVHPSTRASRHICRRYGVSPSIADVIAGLAGLGSEAQQ